MNILLFWAFAITCVDRNAAEEKRLLLTDPEALLSQIHALRLEVQQLKGLTTENQELRHDIADLQNRLRTMESRNQQQGSVYTRWGKRSCPNLNDTVMIYSGTAGGSFFSDKGGASNTLCLPHNPEFLPDDFPLKYSPGEIGFLYGGEYQFSLKNVVIQDDVPCSVCRVNMASSAIMFPAKLSCPSGWKKQYSGLLTSERHDHTRSEYLCLDEDPDFIERSRVNENGRLFHPTLTVCGTLPCPPYRNATYVPCVVCSV